MSITYATVSRETMYPPGYEPPPRRTDEQIWGDLEARFGAPKREATPEPPARPGRKPVFGDSGKDIKPAGPLKPRRKLGPRPRRVPVDECSHPEPYIPEGTGRERCRACESTRTVGKGWKRGKFIGAKNPISADPGDL